MPGFPGGDSNVGSGRLPVVVRAIQIVAERAGRRAWKPAGPGRWHLSLAATPPAGQWLIRRPGSEHNANSMITLLLNLLRVLPVFCGGHRQLALENLALRQQLAVYKRTMARPLTHDHDPPRSNPRTFQASGVRQGACGSSWCGVVW